MDIKLQRRWCRYSLGALLILVTIASLGFGWLGIKARQAQRQRQAVEAITDLRGYVMYDYEIDLDRNEIKSPVRPGPEFLRKLIGDDFVSNVAVAYLGAETTDADLSRIAGLSHLRELYLRDTQVTDAGLVHVAGLTKLESLVIANTQMADAGLVHLKDLNKLESLNLSRTPIGDTGLLNLQGLRRLKELRVQLTQVTDEGVKKLQKALPKLKIYR